MTGRITRREALALGAGMGALAFAGLPALAQQRFFRIGTGGTGGTYYPVGGMIANAISTDKINVSAVATNGSVANVNGIVGGSMESGFSQADVNTGPIPAPASTRASQRSRSCASSPTSTPRACTSWSGRAPASRSSPISRASASRSTSRARARWSTRALILAAYGITEKDIKPEYLKPNQAPRRSRTARSTPSSRRRVIRRARSSELAATNGIELVPIDGPRRDKLMAQYTFFAEGRRSPPAPTRTSAASRRVAVGAQWVTSSKQPDDLVYEITKALWSDKTRAALDAGHAKGKAIRKETALPGVGIPLHAGRREVLQGGRAC